VVLGRWRVFRQLPRRTQIALVSLALGVVLLFIPLVTYAYFARDINDPERLMNRNRTGIVLLDRNGEEFYSSGRINSQDNVGLDKISDHLEKALIASEDKEFYNHRGYSLRGTLLALYANILNKDLTKYGGSTITQQLVKNTLLTNDKNFLRKYQEVSIAIAVDRQYSKDEILAMYLNSVYFGEGAFGIAQAAEVYFGKTAQDLTVAESSMLVGLLPAPSAYSPLSGDKAQAKEQQEGVLGHMVESGYINDKQKNQAQQAELSYAAGSGEEAPEHAQHFAMMVLDELNERYGEEKVIRSGYQVTTGLDLGWQKAAEEQVRQRVAELSAQGGTNAGLVAIDPKSGQLRVLVGSADWNNAEFGKVNMAFANRQPGSSFKPIYYAEALDKKLITPATILKDEPITFADGYEPLNYDFAYRGDITVRRALALSLNITAVEVMQKVGAQNASEAARRMGISTITEPEKYGLTLALGTAEAKLLEMTNAYAAFANQGMQFETANIISIKDKFDKTIRTEKPKSKRVIGEEASFLTSSILSDYDARQPTFGYSLSLEGRDAAVKTGTTDDNRDAWTIGYTPSLSVGVWVGNNANKPMSGVAGSSGAAPIWRNSMQQFLGDSPAENFSQPSNVVSAFICSANGKRAQSNFAGTYTEYFIRGTIPEGQCAQPEPPREKPRKKEQDDDKDKEKEEIDEKPREDEPDTEETPPVDEETEEPNPEAEEPAPDGTNPGNQQPLTVPSD
jgi:1A family penicillin-binding protein